MIRDTIRRRSVFVGYSMGVITILLWLEHDWPFVLIVSVANVLAHALADLITPPTQES